MAVVHPLRGAGAEDAGPDRVNVVRLIEFLGPVSPELALVDSELAERARALLPELPGARLSRPERAEPIPLRLASRPGARRFSRKPAIVAALATVAGVFFGLGLSMTDARSTNATALRSRPPATAPVLPASVPQSPATTTTAPSESKPSKAPRFVWPAEPRADGYRLALFRGGHLIFERDVTEPALHLPSSWTFKGRFESLKPGKYYWVVWPYYGRVKLLGPAIVSAQYAV